MDGCWLRMSLRFKNINVILNRCVNHLKTIISCKMMQNDGCICTLKLLEYLQKPSTNIKSIRASWKLNK